MLTVLSEYRTILVGALGSVVVALLAGKALRRLLLLPFQILARRTETKQDDVIVDEAEKDLGIQHDPRQDQ